MNKPLAVLLALLAVPSVADEGMWLINDFPAQRVKEKYGSAPSADDLKRMQLGAVRLANGCSASFVGTNGLVMTNHHCMRPCLEQLSTGGRDLLSNAFLAKTPKDELRCPKDEANQLLAIEDVSARVLKAIAGVEGAELQKKLNAEKAAIESACAGDDPKKRCDVVTLFDGAVFHLYTYKRMQDVRLVFAPEFKMAAFGGDPDNFNFPRFGLDMAFVRIWDGDKPMASPDALQLTKDALKTGDVVYVVGHPGGTERQRTAAQLELQRDVALPWTLLRLAELRGRMDEWVRADKKREAVGGARLRTIENGLKALRGRRETLAGPGFLDERRKLDAALAQKDAKAKAALADIDAAMADARALWVDHKLYEGAEAFQSELFGLARVIVRLNDEIAKPNGERLSEYTDARRPALMQQLQSTAAIPLDFEQATLAWSLERWRNLKGADDPIVKQLLGTRPARDVAKELVTKTKLTDPKVRMAYASGARKLDALPLDPLIELARAIDPHARAVRKAWEDKVEAKETRAAEALAAARRAQAKGQAGQAPDATFSLRVSYGAIGGTKTAPDRTTIGGLLERAGPSHPFALAPTWAKAKPKLDGALPMNYSSTNDMIGGNSGSPLIDAKGRVVGLCFDGNLASLGGRFTYDPIENRAVSVASPAIHEALTKVYGADALAAELFAAR
jgi:hypothetical protein